MKQHWVSAWTNQYTHFNNTTSSRAEGGHSFLKAFIRTSTGQLLHVVKSVKRALELQLSEFHNRNGMESINHLVRLPTSLSKLNGKISHFALKSVADLFKDAAQSNHTCSGVTRMVNGWPCVHQIIEWETNRQYFQVSDFHPQWRLLEFDPSSYDPDVRFQVLLFFCFFNP